MLDGKKVLLQWNAGNRHIDTGQLFRAAEKLGGADR